MSDFLSPVIAENMKARRKHLKMTLEEVAQKAGTSRSYIWELEHSIASRTSIATLLNVADALDTSVSHLVGFSLDKVRRRGKLK